MSATSMLRISMSGLLCLTAVTHAAGRVSAATPRSERVTARVVERAYARQAIAEARASRAEARVAEIAPIAPVPPPPRPATVRRMARAGVPLAGGPASPPGSAAASAAAAAPPRPTGPAVAAGSAAPRQAAAADDAGQLILASPNVALPDDGTRSVLTTAEEPAASPAKPTPAAAPTSTSPAELLPTPPSR